MIPMPDGARQVTQRGGGSARTPCRVCSVSTLDCTYTSSCALLTPMSTCNRVCRHCSCCLHALPGSHGAAAAGSAQRLR